MFLSSLSVNMGTSVFPVCVNLSACKWLKQRMCDPFSTKGLSAESMLHSLPPTTTGTGSKSRVRHVCAELEEECVTCHTLFCSDSLGRSLMLNTVTAA